MNYVELIPRALFALATEMLGALLIGAVVFVILLIVRRAHKTDRAYRAALAVLVVWAGARVILPFVTEPWQVHWWAYTPPLVVAIVVAAVELVRVLRSPGRPEVPVTPVVHRGWLSFSRRRDWITATAALAALLAVSVAAGVASSPDENGWYSLLLIPVGDQGSGSSTFFGWAYGVPVMVGAVLLAGLVYGVLRASASRPFTRPQTVGAESEQRRALSRVVVGIAAASVLIVLGEALRMIGGAGSGSVGVGIPGVGTFTNSPGFSSFAPAMILTAGALQIWALVWLLLITTGRRIGKRVAR